MKNAVAYARFSSDGQREESIDAQIRAIEKYCLENDYNLIRTYVDEARSATSDNRPSFQEMIKDSKDGFFDFVIVHKLDRFSRNRYDSAIYKKELKNNGVRILSVLEKLDDSPESVILESLLEGMAEYYSKNLAREVKKGLYENALKAKHNGGKPPLGYDVDENKNYVINNYEAEIVRLIFNCYAEGKSHNETIEILKRKNYKTINGNDFSKTTLLAILKNEKYKGTYVFNRTKPKEKGKKRSNKSRNEKDIIKLENAMPAIIDSELWAKVNNMVNEKSKYTERAKNKAKEPYLLSGLLYCGECGSKMFGDRNYKKKRGKEYIYYKCAGRKNHKTDCKMKPIERDRIEEKIIDWLQNDIFNEDLINETALKIKAACEERLKNNNTDTKITSLNKSISDIDKQLNNISNVIAEGLVSETLINKLKDLEEKKENMKIEVLKLKKEKDLISINIEEIKSFIKKHSNIKFEDRKTQHQILKTLIKKITISENENGNLIVSIIPCMDTGNGGTGT